MDADVFPEGHLCIQNVKHLAILLQSIRSTAKQTCIWAMSGEGLSIRWEDDSKSLQSSVFLKAELFVTYACTVPHLVLGLSLNPLVDTLNVLASGTPGTLTIRYPGRAGDLVCEMNETFDGTDFCHYAHLSCVEESVPRDITDYWEDPVSYFLVQGAKLREAIEDLEWPGGDVELFMQRDPQKLVLSSGGNGQLEVEMDTTELSAFHVAVPLVRHRYRHKHIRAACPNLPPAKELGNLPTKVSIDVNGLLKVTHMIAMSARPAAAPMQNVGFTQSQGPDAARVGVIQFVMLPQEEEAEDGA